MNTEWKHEYELKEGDMVIVGPANRLLVRTFNPLSPDEEVCRVITSKPPLTKEQRTIIEWLARVSKSFLGCASHEERKEIQKAVSIAEVMLRE